MVFRTHTGWPIRMSTIPYGPPTIAQIAVCHTVWDTALWADRWGMEYHGMGLHGVLYPTGRPMA